MFLVMYFIIIIIILFFNFKTCDPLVNFSSLFDFLQLVEHQKQITCEKKITAFLLVTCQALRAFTSMYKLVKGPTSLLRKC
jgi:hypothetical protein